MNVFRKSFFFIVLTMAISSSSAFALAIADLNVRGSWEMYTGGLDYDWNGHLGSWVFGSVEHDGLYNSLNDPLYGGTISVGDSSGSSTLAANLIGATSVAISNADNGSRSWASAIGSNYYMSNGTGKINFVYDYILQYTLTNTLPGETSSVDGYISLGNFMVNFSDTLSNVGSVTVSKRERVSQWLDVYDGFQFGSYISYDTSTAVSSPAPVPEPSTAALLAMGLGAISLYVIRKRRAEG